MWLNRGQKEIFLSVQFFFERILSVQLSPKKFGGLANTR
jgi:hypothetical protein